MIVSSTTKRAGKQKGSNVFIVEFDISKEGLIERLRIPGEEDATPLQRMALECLRNRYHEWNRDLLERQRNRDAKVAEEMIKSDPNMRTWSGLDELAQQETRRFDRELRGGA